MGRGAFFAAKLVFTALAVFVQLAATGILLFVAMGCFFTVLGDNDDGTFTPTALRTLQGCLLFALFFVAWIGVLFVTIRGELRLWRNGGTVCGYGEPRQR